MNDLQRMKELIKKINEADEAYFKNDSPIMTDREYDGLVLELKILERTTGIRFSNSPIGKIPSDEKEGLESVRHSKPMLSCNKTKDINDILKFASDKEVMMSWKMDGLTLVLRYENGKFVQGITRGSGGLIGEDVTHTVKHLRNIPLAVPYKDNFEVRGEGVLSWEDGQILAKLGEASGAHPRSIASGAVRNFTVDKGKLSHIDFFAFELIKNDAPKTKREQLDFLKNNNFDVVEHKLFSASENEDLKESIETWTPAGFAYPVDGIVFEFNDIEYGKSLGATAHHEKRMIALKWKDEVKETIFRGVELNTTRTGLVSIVGLFDEVEIDSSRVHRASLHNLSNFEKYKFGEGDIITVYKANMIVPQIAENKMMSGTYEIPMYCPCCGEHLEVKTSQSGVRNLYCHNDECLSRHARKIARFCDKNAMNIDGLSTSVVEKMMAYGWISTYQDIYHLDIHKDDIVNRPGFGVDRYRDIWTEIQSSRKCHMYQFLVGIDIPHLGPEAAKALHRYFYGSMKDFEKAVLDNFAFSHIAEVSETVERSIYAWFADEKNVRLMHGVMTELEFIGAHKELDGKSNPFFETNVAVTGTFDNFTREGIIELITALGAKTVDNITSETNYLIYGSVPGNKKIADAIENHVTILSEKDFGKMLEKGDEENAKTPPK
jgi:DNA ligase (NAD+)